MAEQWREPVLGPCSCTGLRRASRAVTAFYDGMLAPAGLTVTQYAILVNVARAGVISRTELAARLGMDRTTATRNLRPLEREGLLTDQAGEDRRERAVALTAAGRRRMEKGFVLWERAQTAFAEALGEDALGRLRAVLAEVGEAARKVGEGESR